MTEDIVTFYQMPEANAGQTLDSICGSIYELQAVGASFAEGEWTYGDIPSGSQVSFSPAISDTTDVNISEHGWHEFFWTEYNTGASQCSDVDTVNILFINQPEPDAGADFDVCGHYACFNAVAGTDVDGGQWIDPGGIGWGSGPPYTPDPSQQYIPGGCVYSANLNVPVEFVWTEYKGMCTGKDTVTVWFWAEDPAWELVGPTDTSVCGLSFESLNASSPIYGTGYWIDGTSSSDFYEAGILNNAVTSPDSAVADNYGWHDFYWIVANPANGSGCIDTSDVVPVHFKEIPQAEAGVEDTIACGACIVLDAQPSIGVGGWSALYGGNIHFNNTGLDYSPIPNDTVCSDVFTYQTNTYVDVIWTEDNMGCTHSDTTRVMFAIEPNALIDYIERPYCVGMFSVIEAEVNTNINDTNYCIESYIWNFASSGGVLDTIMMDSLGYDYIIDTITGNVIMDSLGQYVSVYWPNSSDTAHLVTLITENCYGCPSGINNFYVYEPPAIDPTAGVHKEAWCGIADGQIVLDMENSLYEYVWILDSTQLDPTSTIDPLTGEVVYSSFYEDGEQPDNTSDSLLIDGLAGDSTYFILVETPSVTLEGTMLGYQCYDTLVVSIVDTGYVVADFDSASYTFDNYIVPEDIVFDNLSDNGQRYWYYYYKYDCNDTTDIDYIDVSTAEGGDFSFALGEEGCYKVFMIARSKEGCIDTSAITTFELFGESLIEVPNIFTPNGDGMNDEFKVKYRSINEFHCVIVNRWGKRIYEWDNVAEGWNGLIKGKGAEASPGVYYYVITATGGDNKPYEFQGFFHLMKEK